jgi:hypothetical protein
MKTFYCLRFETLPTWRARSQYLYHPGTVWPGYTFSGTGLPFRRLLPVAGLRWRFPTPPPHGRRSRSFLIFFLIRIVEGWSPNWVPSARRQLLAYCTCPGDCEDGEFDRMKIGTGNLSIRRKQSQHHFVHHKSHFAVGSQRELWRGLSRSLLPARSFLVSSPAGTHGHISVKCQDVRVFFLSLFLPTVKGGVGLFILYRLVFTYHTRLHLSLHSFSSPTKEKYRDEQFVHSPAYDKARTENTRPTILLLLRVYSLLWWRVYQVVTWQRYGVHMLKHKTDGRAYEIRSWDWFGCHDIHT